MAEGKNVNGSLALTTRQPRVITIDATEQPRSITLRVAAYCRVSSDSEDQLNSFAAQNHYYTTLIAGKENCSLVDVYADRGITGTSAEKRDDFQRLMADCRRGLVDRVLTKSVSRFARNTKECLEALRELKLLGIGVQFEKEGIDTSMMSSEFMTAFFATFAQEESVSISKNMRWSYEKRMKMGTFIPSHQPFGYLLIGGKVCVDEVRARHIREIFSRFLDGWNTQEIADYLIKQIPEYPELQDVQWSCMRVAQVLQNEKYSGNSLWQKSFRTETLPHKELDNHGERPQYYAEDTHPAIISKEIFQRTQALLQRHNQRQAPTPESLVSPFRRILVCSHCGGYLRRRTIHAIAYRACRQHDADISSCPLMPVREEQIKQSFLRLYYNLKHHNILPQMLKDLQTIRTRKMLWAPDVVELNKKISELSSQDQMLAELKKQGLVDPDIFIAQTDKLASQLRDLKLQKERLLSSAADTIIDRTQELIEVLEDGPDFLETFDGELFGELVDKIIVESVERVRFRLKNGLELPETMERTVR